MVEELSATTTPMNEHVVQQKNFVMRRVVIVDVVALLPSTTTGKSTLTISTKHQNPQITYTQEHWLNKTTRRISIGPQLPFSEELHATKYRLPSESFEESTNRIACALKDNDDHYHQLRDILGDMRFLPAGRVQSAMGSSKAVTAYNCFVSGTIEDSLVDGGGSIMARCLEAAATMQKGGGIGYDFSKIRPHGDLINKLQSSASGPISFMEILNAICLCISSSGHRRGAQMGVLRVDHPDIEAFIHSKQPPKEAEPIMEELQKYSPGTPEWIQWYGVLQSVFRLTGFNISIGLTNDFMRAVKNDTKFALTFNGKSYKEIQAVDLWEQIMRSTWDYAEPGALFIDTINDMNNLWYCETITATNPCFTGDTKVWTAEHGHVEFSKLVGKDVDVLTQAANGELVYRRMSKIRRTQKKAQLVEVRLNNNTSVRCTPHHKFFLKDGRTICAEDLIEGDSLCSVYRYNANQKGYKRLTNGHFQPLEHHVPFDVPSEWHVHHKNRIKDDNRPSNLELMPASEHNAMHMRGDSNPLRKYPNRNPMKLNPDCTRGKKNGRWRHDLDTEKMVTMRENGDSYQSIAFQCGCSKYTAQKRIKDANHRVVSVEWLDDKADVYCGTVDDPSHRFFVATGDNDGVLVANCGEQPLPPFGACLLGSFNLTKYVDSDKRFKWSQFSEDIMYVVRAMDNVVDRSIYPLKEQELEAKNKRRMGLGVTGLANALEYMGMEYGSEKFIHMEGTILKVLKNGCYFASCELAKEKGAFPLYEEDKYMQGLFINGLEDYVKDHIRKHGIRNSHLTSIAPTGTISMTADNISSGIEPVFAYSQKRLVNMPTGQIETQFDDYGYSRWGVEGKRCEDVTADEHLDVLECASRNVDSAVSKTCNVPPDMPWEDFKGVYMKAWERGCKGITTFQPKGKRAGILKSIDNEKKSCRVDPKTGRKECD